MEFDILGHLSPYTLINSTLEEFEADLVQKFPFFSTRYEIFEGYRKYLSNLKSIIGGDFYQWIDGSFVTDKMNPNDIDVVSFIKYDIFLKHENSLKNMITPESKLVFKVDAAIVPIYPQNHRLRAVTEWDIRFWKDFYGKTRPDIYRNQMQKGFIQLNF